MSQAPPTRHSVSIGDPRDRVAARRCRTPGPHGTHCTRRSGHAQAGDAVEALLHEAPQQVIEMQTHTSKTVWWRWSV